MTGEISLYFHIPFCTRKCDYCHFFVLPDKEDFKDQLMEGLSLEWSCQSDKLQSNKLISVYFGGGTPSLLGSKRIAEILSWIPTRPSEITLEVNPENVTLELMQAYADVGINRVSLGIQTLDDQLLHLLTRQHSSRRAKEAVLLTHQAGIQNISIDLMYDLPKQQLSSWKETLLQAIELPITHLSLYNLTFEPHTVFYKKKDLLNSQLPNEQESLAMYEAATQILEDQGLKQYEISAFAREGFQSRHNMGYWTARPFLGFGPSAFSYWKNRRYRNVSHLNKYVEALKEGRSPIDFEEELDEQARARELLVVELRLLRGVQLGKLDVETLGILQKLAGEGYLELGRGSVQLTRKGVLFYDTVASELI